MSFNFLVFVEKERLLTVVQLLELAKEKSLILEEWNELNNLLDIEGYWPGEYQGEATGFEFFIDDIEDEDLENWEINRNQLPTQTLVAELTIRSDIEIKAASICCALLCKYCNGLTFDDSDQLTINEENCDIWLNNYL